MALTQNDRIAISKKIVSVDLDNAIIDNTILQLQSGVIEAQNKDGSNISLIDDVDLVIVPYQQEISVIEGKQRVVLQSSDYFDAAKGVTGNLFFPNDNNTTVPSIGSQVWTQLTPFAGNGAIGKNKAETYADIAGEEPSITALQAAIAAYDAAPPLEQPPLLTAVETAAQAYRAQLLSVQSSIWTTDPDPTRDAQNQQAIIDVQTAINQIDAYLSNTSNTTLAETAIANRAPVRIARKAEINAVLGNIVQDLSTGQVTGGSGFYFRRFNFIVLRLDLLGGSLAEQTGIERGIAAQNSQKVFNSNSAIAYSTAIYTSAFKAPAANTGTLHLKETTGFTVGDSVYVVAENQQELAGNVVNITDNIIFLDIKIPQKYTHENLGRVYKVL